MKKLKFHSIIEKMIEKICINKNIYSEDEVIIGYVIKNNKKMPVYRKEFVGNTGSENHKYVEPIENLDEIIQQYGIAVKDDYKNTVPSYLNNDNFIELTTDNANRVYLYFSNLYRDSYYRVTVEYTKITDL